MYLLIGTNWSSLIKWDRHYYSGHGIESRDHTFWSRDKRVNKLLKMNTSNHKMGTILLFFYIFVGHFFIDCAYRILKKYYLWNEGWRANYHKDKRITKFAAILWKKVYLNTEKVRKIAVIKVHSVKHKNKKEQYCCSYSFMSSCLFVFQPLFTISAVLQRIWLHPWPFKISLSGYVCHRFNVS